MLDLNCTHFDFMHPVVEDQLGFEVLSSYPNLPHVILLSCDPTLLIQFPIHCISSQACVCVCVCCTYTSIKYAPTFHSPLHASDKTDASLHNFATINFIIFKV